MWQSNLMLVILRVFNQIEQDWEVQQKKMIWHHLQHPAFGWRETFGKPGSWISK